MNRTQEVPITFKGGTLDESLYKDLRDNNDVSFGSAWDTFRKILDASYKILDSKPVKATTTADSVYGIGKKSSKCFVNFLEGKEEKSIEDPSKRDIDYLIEDPDKKGIKITKVTYELKKK